ncbi:cytochrome P450 9e2-like [Megachile rotundata]|uniref:cytochrome P450 9e2-like n=1 Tax=Megachile rotundata TaxID=143995 RepID=UPI003FCFF0D8
MASTFLKLLVVVVVLLVVYVVKAYSYWKRRGIPTAKGVIPFLGHMLPVFTFKVNVSELIREMYTENKDVSMVGFYKMTTPVLLIRDPHLSKIVLQKNFSSFQDTGVRIHPDKDPLLSTNPFFSTGEVWSNSRKRLVSAFTNVKLKMLSGVVNGVCKKMEDFLDRRIRKNECEIELKWFFSKFTGEVVANAGIGVEGFCFEDESHPDAFDRIGDLLFKSGFKMVLENTVVFAPRLNDILKLRLVPKKVDKFFRDVVRQTLITRKSESVPRKDFLQSIIDYELAANGKFDEETIASEALSIYMDGYETSSITLSFIGFHLASHPDIQEKVREEVMSKLEKHDGVITFEALKEMTYMDQVISESQRCYPAIGFLTRVCTQRCELRGSDGLVLHVDPGVEIVISNHGLQVDPEYWSDPDVFDPERFRDNQPTEKLIFLPFGQGPRICAGVKLAKLQMKSCISSLLSKYRLELSKKTLLPLKFSSFNFVSEPIGGLWVHVSKL